MKKRTLHSLAYLNKDLVKLRHADFLTKASKATTAKDQVHGTQILRMRSFVGLDPAFGAEDVRILAGNVLATNEQGRRNGNLHPTGKENAIESRLLAEATLVISPKSGAQIRRPLPERRLANKAVDELQGL